jgi:hypothetical protein
MVMAPAKYENIGAICLINMILSVHTVTEQVNFLLAERVCSVNNMLGRWLSSGLLRRVVWQKSTDVSEVFAASTIALMMDLRDMK